MFSMLSHVPCSFSLYYIISCHPYARAVYRIDAYVPPAQLEARPKLHFGHISTLTVIKDANQEVGLPERVEACFGLNMPGSV